MFPAGPLSACALPVVLTVLSFNFYLKDSAVVAGPESCKAEAAPNCDKCDVCPALKECDVCPAAVDCDKCDVCPVGQKELVDIVSLVIGLLLGAALTLLLLLWPYGDGGERIGGGATLRAAPVAPGHPRESGFRRRPGV